VDHHLLLIHRFFQNGICPEMLDLESDILLLDQAIALPALFGIFRGIDP